MSEFEFPTNVKQIGSIGDGLRIYIEDYACSYLQHYAEAGGYEERLAFLVGRVLVIDNQTVLFISGVIQGQHTATERDMVSFTEKSWQHAKDEIKRYFKGLDIVGWMQSQPGYGVFLNSGYAAVHSKIFPREDQVLFVIDPAEKLNAFYIYDASQEKLTESQGYFIYYDKNRGMQEYMLDNKISSIKMRPLPEVEDAVKPVIKKAGISAEERTILMSPLKKKSLAKFKGSRKKSGQWQVVNLLMSLSAVLFVVCFIMGAGLIQNDGRISSLEGQLTQLNTAYRNLLVEMQQGQAAAVFAGQDTYQQAAQIQPNAQEGQTVLIEDGNSLLTQDLLAMAEPITTPTPPEPTPSPSPSPAPAPVAVEPEPATVDNPPPAQAQAQAPAVEPKPAIPETYTVQAGDSLSLISQRFYGSQGMVLEIMRVNGLEDADMITSGKTIKLPQLE